MTPHLVQENAGALNIQVVGSDRRTSSAETDRLMHSCSARPKKTLFAIQYELKVIQTKNYATTHPKRTNRHLVHPVEVKTIKHVAYTWGKTTGSPGTAHGAGRAWRPHVKSGGSGEGGKACWEGPQKDTCFRTKGEERH